MNEVQQVLESLVAPQRCALLRFFTFQIHNCCLNNSNFPLWYCSQKWSLCALFGTILNIENVVNWIPISFCIVMHTFSTKLCTISNCNASRLDLLFFLLVPIITCSFMSSRINTKINGRSTWSKRRLVSFLCYIQNKTFHKRTNWRTSGLVTGTGFYS